MSISRNSAVLWNQAQGLQVGEQDQARANIDAAKNATATQSSNGLMSAADKTKLDGIAEGAGANVQSDWTQTNSSAADYIKNKPGNATQSTDGFMSAADKTKLDGIQSGAEVNVQADWNQSNSSADDYIKNKPSNLVQDASYVHTDNNFTNTLKTKLDGIEAGAEVNVQADWNQTDNAEDDYIKNKPENLVQDASYVHTDNNFTNTLKTKLDGIAAGAEVNVQSDWNQSNTSADDYIKNKPSNLVQDASYVHTDNNFTNTLKNKLDGIASGAEVNVQSDWNQTNTSADDYIKNKPGNATSSTAGFMSAADKTKLDGIQSGAEANVQADWSQTNSAYDDYIKNKPGNATASTAGLMSSGDKTKLDGIQSGAEANVQSNWTQTNTSADDYIKNKPTVPELSWTQTTQGSSTTYVESTLNIDQDNLALKLGTNELGSLVPIPPSAPASDKYIKLVANNDIPIWADAPTEVFIATYGQTSFSSMSSALNEGKLVILRYNSSVYALPSRIAPTYIYFTATIMTGNLFTAGVRHFICDDTTGWRMNPFSLNGTMDANLPSVMTNRVTTTLQDSYDDWLTIGAIKIGGHGTSSGNIQVGIKSSSSSMTNSFVYDIVHRTSSTSEIDNKITYDTISTTANYQLFFQFTQYDGTSTVDCSYIINLYDTTSTTPSHYRIYIRKTFMNQSTTLFLTGEHIWGDVT